MPPHHFLSRFQYNRRRIGVKMCAMFECLSDVCSGKQAWKFKVQVIRMWSVYLVGEPKKPFSTEMLLIDLFNEWVKEGVVYVMSFLGVTANSSSSRVTHDYKLLFHVKTSITTCLDLTLPQNGLTIMKAEEVKNTEDVMGVLCAASAEKVTVKDGKTIRLIQLELRDET
ncbi:hypothetical protein GmHk_04G010905 [Glycine max]|nr:hypothetical protein GmHk_04G010905 [Glycine max]